MNVEIRNTPEQQLRLNNMIKTLNIDNPTADYVAKQCPSRALCSDEPDQELRNYLMALVQYYNDYVKKSMIR
jgi:hypothetical protein